MIEHTSGSEQPGSSVQVVKQPPHTFVDVRNQLHERPEFNIRLNILARGTTTSWLVGPLYLWGSAVSLSHAEK